MENSKSFPLWIRIIDILSLEPGTDLTKDSVEAVFPAKVRWHDVSLDKHIAELAPEEFVTEADINILDWRKENITPGYYKKTIGPFGQLLFEKHDPPQKKIRATRRSHVA